MKIIVATGQYPPTVSGIASVSEALVSNFEKMGHEIELITEGSGCRRLGKAAVLDSEGKATIDRGGDVLQVIGPTPIFTEQCIKYAKRRGLAVVYKLDALPGLQTFFNNYLARAVDKLYERTWLNPQLKQVDHVVFSTKDLASRYPYYRGPVTIIPLGLHECTCQFPRIEVSQGIGHAVDRAEEIAVLFVGQLRPYKGLRFLLKAISQLNQPGKPRVSLTVIGDGPEKSKLLRLVLQLNIPDKVRFLGKLPDSDLHVAYLSHDVLVLPSISAESFGLVLLEAKRHGMAIVATDLPGTRSVASSLGGVVVRPGDSSSLANGILAAMNNRKSERDTVVSPLYAWPNIANEYLSLYETLIHRGRFGKGVVDPPITMPASKP